MEAGVTHINFSTHFARIGFYQSITITRGGDWKKICSEKMPKLSLPHGKINIIRCKSDITFILKDIETYNTLHLMAKMKPTKTILGCFQITSVFTDNISRARAQSYTIV